MQCSKIITVLLVFAMIIPLFTGCSRETAEENQDMVTISVGIWPDSSDISAQKSWEIYRDTMSEEYPNITLEPAPISYSFDGIVAMAASGNLPTIFQVYFTEPQRLISNGFIADITSYAEEYGYLEGQNSEMLALASSDGKQYGIVRDAYGMALLINMRLFRSAGLVREDGTPIYPKTFDELAETALSIHEMTGKAGFCIPTKGGHGGWQFTNIAWAFGANFEYEDENGRLHSGLGDEPAADAMNFIKRLRWELNVMPEQTSVGLGDYISMFAEDEVAMILAAPDAIRNILMQGSIGKDELAVAPVPSRTRSVSLMGGTMYVFSSFASDEQLDACFKLLEVMGVTPYDSETMKTALENELKIQSESGLAVLPSAISVWTSPERAKTEESVYNNYINVDMKLFEDYYEQLDDMLAPECKINCQEMYAALDTCIYTVLSNSSCDVERLMSETANSFEQFYYY